TKSIGSSPIRSVKARVPIGWLAPSIIALSISSAEAIPSDKMKMDSLIIGVNIRLTANNGTSLHRNRCLVEFMSEFKSFIIRMFPSNDFNQLHDGDGIKEMHSDYLAAALHSSCHFCDV